MPSLLNVMISRFLFKMTRMLLQLVFYRVFHTVVSIKIRCLNENKNNVERPYREAVTTYTIFTIWMDHHLLVSYLFLTTINWQHWRWLITHHHVWHNNEENVLNIVRIIKIWKNNAVSRCFWNKWTYLFHMKSQSTYFF